MPKNVEEVHVGVGGGYVAAVGTERPINLGNPAAPWVHFGFTDEGFTVASETEELRVPADQSLLPIKIVSTGRTTTLSTKLLQISAANLVLAYGGGTITPEIGYDLYTPPAIGEEEEVAIYLKLVNEVDGPVRLFFRRARRVGGGEIKFSKAEATKIDVSWEVLDPGLSDDPTPVQLQPFEYLIATEA